MGSFVSLFHFDGYASNRLHEDQFQFFIVEKGKSVGPVAEKRLKKLLDAKSDHFALMSLAGAQGQGERICALRHKAPRLALSPARFGRCSHGIPRATIHSAVRAL